MIAKCARLLVCLISIRSAKNTTLSAGKVSKPNYSPKSIRFNSIDTASGREGEGRLERGNITVQMVVEL